MISCLPGSIVYSVLGIVLAPFVDIFLLLLLLDHFLQYRIETLKALVPEAAILPHPLRSLFQPAAFQPAGPTPQCVSTSRGWIGCVEQDEQAFHRPPAVVPGGPQA